MTLVFLFSASHSVTVSPSQYFEKEFLFMEVIYSKACGVDVHKRFIIAVICDFSSAKPEYIRKRFSTFNNQLIAFKNWLHGLVLHLDAMNQLAKRNQLRFQELVYILNLVLFRLHTQLLKIKIMTIMPINSIRFRSVVARKEQLLPSPEKY